MTRQIEIVIEVPFHDTDSAGVVWHGWYAKYFEVARCALLDTFNFNYDEMERSGYLWPVIDMRLRYVKPARFRQKICVRAVLAEWEHRLKIDYLVTDLNSGERMTKGSTVQVAVNAATGEMCLVSPDILFERLGVSR
jgi:acyl-CoA thioester hydrolase